MTVVSPRSRPPVVTQAPLAWYAGSRVSDVELLAYAERRGIVVVRGRAGRGQLDRLRRAGWQGDAILDPADYEESEPNGDEAEQLQLAPGTVDWVDLQRRLGCVMVLSRGIYVPESGSLTTAIEDSRQELDGLSHGVPSLALHWSWLTNRLAELLAAIDDSPGPLALAFADPVDPLGHEGAVSGFATVCRRGDKVVLLRGDLSAIGACSLGVRLATVGTHTSVRHVVPPGRRGGGSPVRVPSALVEPIASFRRVNLLQGLGHADTDHSLACHHAGCDGETVARFNDPRERSSLEGHNRHALEALIDRVLNAPASDQFQAFRRLTQEAVAATTALSLALNRPIEVPAQLQAWAAL